MEGTDYLRYGPGLGEASETLEARIAGLPKIPPHGSETEVLTRTPLPGNASRQTLLFPYLQDGPEIPVGEVQFLPYSMPGRVMVTEGPLPLVWEVEALQNESQTEYGVSTGPAFRLRILLSGVDEIGALEVAFGQPVTLFAIEAGTSYSVSYGITSDRFDLAIPRVTESTLDLICALSQPNYGLGGFLVTLDRLRVRRFVLGKTRESATIAPLPGLATRVSGKMKEHQTAPLYRQGGTSPTFLSGIPPRILGKMLPGFAERPIVVGDYQITLKERVQVYSAPTAVPDGTIWADRGVVEHSGKRYLLGSNYEPSIQEGAFQMQEGSGIDILSLDPLESVSTHAVSVTQGQTLRFGIDSPSAEGPLVALLEVSGSRGSGEEGAVRRGDWKAYLSKEAGWSWKDRWEESDRSSLTPRYVEHLELTTRQVSKNSHALSIEALTERGQVILLGSTRFGSVVFDVHERILAFFFRIYRRDRPYSVKQIDAKSRQEIHIASDGWLRFPKAKPGLLLSLSGHRPDGSGGIQEFDREAILLYGAATSETDWLQTGKGSVRLITPNYDREHGEVSLDGPVRVSSITFPCRADQDAPFTLSWNGEYHDNSLVDNIAGPQPPEITLCDSVSLFREGTLDPIDTVTCESENGLVSPFTYQNARTIRQGGTTFLHMNSYADRDDYPGVTFVCGSTDPVVALLKGERYHATVTEPNQEGRFGASFVLRLQDPFFETLPTISEQTIHHKTIPDIGTTAVDGEIHGEWVGSSLEERDLWIPVAEGDRVEVYSRGGEEVHVVYGRDVDLLIENVRLYEGTAASYLVREPSYLREGGENLFPSPRRTFLEVAASGPQGVPSIYLGAPLLTPAEASALDLEDPAIAFPNGSFIRASWARTNLDLLLLNASTMEPVKDEDVFIRWSSGVIEVNDLSALIVVWGEETKGYSPIREKSEETSAVRNRIRTEEAMLLRRGETRVWRIEPDGRRTELEDQTDWKRGGLGAITQVGRDSFAVRSDGSLETGFSGPVYITYKTSLREYFLKSRGILQAEIDFEWQRLFSLEELSRG